jgi:hypothetical protein
MNAEVATILTRIETDVSTLRSLMQGTPGRMTGYGRVTGETNKKKVGKGRKAPPVSKPVLCETYTKSEADIARTEIDAAYDAGIINYDERRGMKRSLTIRTVGWSPDKK